MEKVWFKLRHTHYPPPPEDSILKGTDGVDAPFRLGHLIEDLKSIDSVLNFEKIEQFPPAMQVFKSRMVEFGWNDERSKEIGGSLGASAPVVAAAGMTLGASVEAAFRQSVSSHEKYEALDTYIVQPTQPYVNACMEKQLPMREHGRWKHRTLFMITGLCVARHGRRSTSEERHVGGGFNIEADVPQIAGVNASFNIPRETSTSIEGRVVTDFVWAVRFARIHKGFLSTDWSVKTYTEGATFSASEDDIDVAAMVDSEGLPRESIAVVEDEQLDCAIVM